MSRQPSQEHALELLEAKNDPQPEQLLLQKQPHIELIDFGEIGGFLREKNDDLGNSYNFAHQQPQMYQQEISFYDRPQQQHIQEHQIHHQRQLFANDHKNHNQISLRGNEQYGQKQQTAQLKGKPLRKCICKKTQCLKMYCECFASGSPCTEECTCLSCKNTLEHQKEIFEAKLMIHEKGVVGLHSCSLSEKRCNCKKSNCLKKYCECFNSGVKCSEACKCQACKNCDNPKQDMPDGNNPVKTVKNGKARKQKKSAQVQLKN